MKTEINNMPAGEAMELSVESLIPHPLNRKWKKDEDFSSLRESIRKYGVLTPLLVSAREDGSYCILAGERRWRSAKALKISLVPAVVRELTSREELEVLVIENLERQDPDPVEESRLVSALLAEGYDAEALAERLSRSVEWIQSRQMLLDLGDDVHECLRRPRDADDHLSIGAAMAIAAAPPQHREAAVQLVLHPDYQDGPLSAARAHAAVKAIILKPLRRAEHWAAMGPKLKKAWQKRLREVVGKEMAMDLAVVLGGVDERYDFPRMAEAEQMIRVRYPVTAGGMGKSWAHMAARHGLAVRIIPTPGVEGECIAVVDSKLLEQAEKARGENKMDTWIAQHVEDSARGSDAGSKGGSSGEIRDDDDDDMERVHGESPEEDGETVIDQTVESYAQIRLTNVRRLGKLAMICEEDSEQGAGDLPDWVPAWAAAMLREERAREVSDICEWIMDLRGGC